VLRHGGPRGLNTLGLGPPFARSEGLFRWSGPCAAARRATNVRKIGQVAWDASSISAPVKRHQLSAGTRCRTSERPVLERLGTYNYGAVRPPDASGICNSSRSARPRRGRRVALLLVCPKPFAGYGGGFVQSRSKLQYLSEIEERVSPQIQRVRLARHRHGLLCKPDRRRVLRGSAWRKIWSATCADSMSPRQCPHVNDPVGREGFEPPPHGLKAPRFYLRKRTTFGVLRHVCDANEKGHSSHARSGGPWLRMMDEVYGRPR
jgi:hypothetical protein